MTSAATATATISEKLDSMTMSPDEMATSPLGALTTRSRRAVGREASS